MQEGLERSIKKAEKKAEKMKDKAKKPKDGKDAAAAKESAKDAKKLRKTVLKSIQKIGAQDRHIREEIGVLSLPEFDRILTMRTLGSDTNVLDNPGPDQENY